MIEMPGMKIRRRDTRIWFVALSVFATVFLFTFLTGYFKKVDSEVGAASLDGFDPGFIISDWQMGRYDAMSEAEIQAWLTSMNACGNRDYDYYLRLSANTAYKWHFANGHFVCLSEELFGDGEVIGEGETAAHIIWQTAQDYRINPQVLLVLLQKETGLITDPIPNDGDYRKATGYGCPDTAPCSSQYYGFKNQVRKAAALFRTVLDGGWTNYPLGENYIQYNPNPDCGGSVVNVRSLATSALYRYTPYQPNEGALAAGRGTAYCGAYGNRNFYLYFEDWFGGIKNEISRDEIINNEIRGKFDSADYSGVYNILYSEDYDRVVGASSDNIQVVSRNSQKNQQWRVEKEDDYYFIINSETGKALDVSGGVASNKVNVWQYNLNKTCAQRWNIVSNDDGTITIHSSCYPQYVLDLADGDTNIQIYKKTDYDNKHQEWRLEPASLIDVESGDYNIMTSDGNKVVKITDSNIEARVFQEADMSRIWNVQRVVGKNYYIITNKNSGKVLGFSKTNVNNKANVKECDVESCYYYWYFEKNDDGVFIRNVDRIVYVLDLADGLNNIQMYHKINDNDHQQWFLRRVSSEDFSGTHTILYGGDSKKAISIEDDILDARVNVIARYYSGKDTQAWIFSKEGDYYIIANKASGKVVDLSGGVFGNKENIWQYNNNGTCAQRWIIEKNNDDTITIQSACYPEYVLDLADGDRNVQVYKKTEYDNDHQKWILGEEKKVDDYSGEYNIIYGGDNRRLIGLESDSSEKGVNIVVGEKNSVYNSRWIVSKEDGYYLITNKNTGKALDLSGGVFGNKENIWQYNVNKTCAQRWNFVRNNDGSLTIFSVCYPEYVLDLADGDRNVQVYKKTEYDNDHQKWILE